MPTPTERGHATNHSRRVVRSERDLLGLGITSLLADGPCHYNPLVLVGAPAATTVVLRDIQRHWKRIRNTHGSRGVRSLFIDPDRLARDLDAAAGDGLDSVHGRWIAAELVLIDGIAQLSSDLHLASLPHLLDRLFETDSRVVCSLASEPKSRSDLPDAVASRLGSGLVVNVRDAAAPVAAAAGGHQPTVRRILAATARHYGLMPDDLAGSSRRRTVALARGIAMYLARQLCGQSLTAIGHRFSGRDHTTVMHAIRVTRERIECDPGIADDCESILAALTARSVRRRT